MDDPHFHCWHIEATVHTGSPQHMIRCCGCGSTDVVHVRPALAVHGTWSVEQEAETIAAVAKERRQRFRDALRGPLARFHL